MCAYLVIAPCWCGAALVVEARFGDWVLGAASFGVLGVSTLLGVLVLGFGGLVVRSPPELRSESWRSRCADDVSDGDVVEAWLQPVTLCLEWIALTCRSEVPFCLCAAQHAQLQPSQIQHNVHHEVSYDSYRLKIYGFHSL